MDTKCILLFNTCIAIRSLDVDILKIYDTISGDMNIDMNLKYSLLFGVLLVLN